MTEIYFPEPVFKNIMEFVGDSKKQKNKELWSRIVVKRGEDRDNIYTHCWDSVDMCLSSYMVYYIIDGKIDWSKNDLLKPISHTGNGWNCYFRTIVGE